MGGEDRLSQVLATRHIGGPVAYPGPSSGSSRPRSSFKAWRRAALVVGRPGLEPGTLGLKVPCSTR